MLLALSANAATITLDDYAQSLDRIHGKLAAQQFDAAKAEAELIKNSEVVYAQGRFHTDDSLLSEVGKAKRADRRLLDRIDLTLTELRGSGASATKSDPKLLQRVAAEQDVPELVPGGNVPTSCYPDDPDEAMKVKVAIALAGKPIVHFDNIEEGQTYGNPALDSALTSLEVDDRILGTSKMTGRLLLLTCWFLSGNNVSPRKDAYRRWLVCNLKTDLEHPEERDDFEHEKILAYVRATPGAIGYVSASASLGPGVRALRVTP